MSFLLQCIISTPDKSGVDGMELFSGIQQVQNINSTGGKEYPDVCLNLTGNTIVFDSFSPKEAVASLNTKINTVSQAKHASKRFPTDFSVQVKGQVSAILSEASAGSYMVIDKPNSRVLTAQTRRTFGKSTDKPTAASILQYDTSTLPTNASSALSSSDDDLPPNAPPSPPLHNIQSKKRPLESPSMYCVQPKRTQPEPRPMMMVHAPVNRFALQQQRHVPFMQQPFRHVNAPPIATTIYRPVITSRPVVVLEKPNYTRSDMKPLFAPSDEDEPTPPKPHSGTPPPRPIPPLFASTPSPPDHNRRPPATPSSFLSPGARYSSDDFVVNIAGRGIRNSSSDVSNVCVVSTKDMLAMDLPGLSSRMSSQEEVNISSIRVPSREESACAVKIGSKVRMASSDEIIAINTLVRMRK